jgi:hypothetical protein
MTECALVVVVAVAVCGVAAPARGAHAAYHGNELSLEAVDFSPNGRIVAAQEEDRAVWRKSVTLAPGALHPLTCVHAKGSVGCLSRIAPFQWGFGPCNADLYGNDHWLWGDEGYGGHTAHAARLTNTTWRVTRDGTMGYVVQLRPTLWRVTNATSRVIGYAHGPDGPAVGLLLLAWGWGCFPDH